MIGPGVPLRLPDERVQAQQPLRRARRDVPAAPGHAVRADSLPGSRPERWTSRRAIASRSTRSARPCSRSGRARAWCSTRRTATPTRSARSSRIRSSRRRRSRSCAARALEAVGAEPPGYPHGVDEMKTSAAWLIERAGFRKGFAGGHRGVSISTKHTLALTNRGERYDGRTARARPGDPRRRPRRVRRRARSRVRAGQLRAVRTADQSTVSSPSRQRFGPSSTGQPPSRSAPTVARQRWRRPEHGERRGPLPRLGRARRGARGPARRGRCGGSAPSAAARPRSPECPRWTVGRPA